MLLDSLDSSLRRSEQRDSPAGFPWILLRDFRGFLRGGGIPWIPVPPPPHHHQHTRSAQLYNQRSTNELSVLFKARLRTDFYFFLHATRHHRAVRRAERPFRAAPCDGGLVRDNQVVNGVVRPPLPVARSSRHGGRQHLRPQRHLREVESNHQTTRRLSGKSKEGAAARLRRRAPPSCCSSCCCSSWCCSSWCCSSWCCSGCCCSRPTTKNGSSHATACVWELAPHSHQPTWRIFTVLDRSSAAFGIFNDAPIYC